MGERMPAKNLRLHRIPRFVKRLLTCAVTPWRNADSSCTVSVCGSCGCLSVHVCAATAIPCIGRAGRLDAVTHTTYRPCSCSCLLHAVQLKWWWHWVSVIATITATAATANGYPATAATG